MYNQRTVKPITSRTSFCEEELGVPSDCVHEMSSLNLVEKSTCTAKRDRVGKGAEPTMREVEFLQVLGSRLLPQLRLQDAAEHQRCELKLQRYPSFWCIHHTSYMRSDFHIWLNNAFEHDIWQLLRYKIVQFTQMISLLFSYMPNTFKYYLVIWTLKRTSNAYLIHLLSILSIGHLKR